MSQPTRAAALWTAAAGVVLLGPAATVATAAAGTLRIAEWNVNADTSDPNSFYNAQNHSNGVAVQTALQAIGNHKLAGNAQPLDVLAVTELSGTSVTGGSTNSGPSQTLATITADLNAVYGAGTYAYDTTVFDPTDGPTSTGNGPSGLVYNTKTIGSVVGHVVDATPTSGNDPRAPVRYLIQPTGGTAGSAFTLYVEHAKASSGTDNATTRANEATLVRQDADALAAGSHVIYTGDLNLAGGSNQTTTSGSAEQSYKDLTAAAGTTIYNGSTAYVTKATGQATDPLDPTGTLTNNAPANTALYTESAVNLTARFDLQLVTANTSATATTGLRLVADTETAFGNSYYSANGTLTTDTAYAGNVSGGSNTALSDLLNAATVLTDLTQISDHLPIVADYDFDLAAAPEPTSLLTTAAAAATLLLGRRRRPLANRSP